MDRRPDGGKKPSKTQAGILRLPYSDLGQMATDQEGSISR